MVGGHEKTIFNNKQSLRHEKLLEPRVNTHAASFCLKFVSLKPKTAIVAFRFAQNKEG